MSKMPTLIPTQKPNNPIEGMMCFDPASHAMTVWNGTSWKVVNMEIEYCCLCKKADYDHEPYSIQDVGHPLFHNNLEYLEWKNEQAERR